MPTPTTPTIPSILICHVERVANGRRERSEFFQAYGYVRGTAERESLTRAGVGGSHVSEYLLCESRAFLNGARTKLPADKWAQVSAALGSALRRDA